MLLIRKLSKTSNRLYRIRYMLTLMWRVISGEARIIEVCFSDFPHMNDLMKDMRMNSKKYNQKQEYSLMEERPFLAVNIQKTMKVEQTKEKMNHG